MLRPARRHINSRVPERHQLGHRSHLCTRVGQASSCGESKHCIPLKRLNLEAHEPLVWIWNLIQTVWFLASSLFDIFRASSVNSSAQIFRSIDRWPYFVNLSLLLNFAFRDRLCSGAFLPSTCVVQTQRACGENAHTEHQRVSAQQIWIEMLPSDHTRVRGVIMDLYDSEK